MTRTKKDTECHARKGGYLKECFITRKANGQTINGREEIIVNLDDFYDVCKEDLELRKERPAMERLRTDGTVLKLDGKTVSMPHNPLRFFHENKMLLFEEIHE